MGKKILMFATMTALAAPLLAIGLIITIPLLYMWVKFFNWVGNTSKEINKGAKMLLYMALATGIVTLTVIMSAYALGDPAKTFMAFLLVAGSMLILSGAYYLMSLVSKPLSTGIKTMLFMALTTAILVAIIIGASYLLGSPGKTFAAFLLMAGSLLVLSGAFFIIGMFKGNVISGSIALLIGSVALIAIGFAIKIFMDINPTWGTLLLVDAAIIGLAVAMSFAGGSFALISLGAIGIIISSVSVMILSKALETWMGANVTWEGIGMLGAAIVGLGVAMAGWGLGAILIIPGAAAMVIAATGMFIFTKSLVNFKEAKWKDGDTDTMLYSMDTILRGFVDIFDDLSYSDIAKALAGTLLLGELGNSMSQFAQGVAAMAKLQAPEYAVKDGKLVLVGTKALDPDFAQKVGQNIQVILDAVIDPLAKLGANEGFFFAGPVGNGIKLLGKLGNSLSNFARGVAAMAKLQVPTYKVNDKGDLVLESVEPLSPDFAQKMGQNIKMMVEPLTGSNGILAQLGAQEGVIFNGPIGNGINLLAKLGNSLSGFAEGVQAWANLTIPIYGTNEKGEVIVKELKPLDKDFATKVGTNIDMIVDALINPIKKLGKQDGGWLFSSEFEDGIAILGRIGEPLNNLAQAAKTLSDINIKPLQLQKTVSGIIGSFVSALSKDALKDLNEKQGKKVLDGFNYFANAVEKMKGGETEKVGAMFVSMKDSINDMDLKKLNKLTALAQNLSNFAKHMKGSFGELEGVLERLVDVVKEMNGIQISAANTNKPQTKMGDVKVDLLPLIQELDEIKSVLLSGIEVEVKENTLSR